LFIPKLFPVGFNQKTTLERPLNHFEEDGSPTTKVGISIQEVKDLKLHISNLVGGKRIIGKYPSICFLFFFVIISF